MPHAPEVLPAYADAFASGLFDPRSQKPGFVTGPNGKGADTRFDVYRNNVAVGLVNALASMFPATQRIVGEEFFRAMARRFVRACPPRSRLLAEYGHDLPAFIADFEPLAGMPWLADVAAIERAWLDAYHAADVAPLAIGDLAAISQELLAEAVLAPHPAARLVRSRFAAVTIFSANRQDGEVGATDASVAEDALIVRPQLDVSIRILPPGGAAFLEALFTGRPLGEAAEAALEESAAFDLGANITGMIEAGALVSVKAGPAE